MYKKILVALDGSKQTESILGRVGVLATKHQAEVTLLMVLPVPMIVIENGRLVATIDQEEERLRFEHQPYLDEWKSRLESVGVKTSTAIRFGDAATQIADCAKEYGVDLIVMSPKARKGLDRLFRRSVTSEVVRSVTTPVLLMRAA